MKVTVLFKLWLHYVLLISIIVVFISFTVDSSELIQYDHTNDKVINNVHASETLLPSKDNMAATKDVSIDASLEEIHPLEYNFLHAFLASISVIIVSELGDKTFFIAAIMAMKHSRVTVFIGAILALGLMTVLSVFLGFATTVIPRKYTFYISTALFAIFGLKMLKEGYDMDPDEGKEELEEVTAELKKKEAEMESLEIGQDIETGMMRSALRKSKLFRLCSRLFSPIFLQTFTMTFLAEWGDRSQLTTIILGSRENPVGVTIGGTIGHALCTGLAVLGGRLVAQKISVRTVTLVGGVVFLLFAFSALLIGDSD